MSSIKVGRNEPCPCGSGKKYKHCCITNSFNEQTNDELSQFLAGKDFTSIEEAQASVNQFMGTRNNQPLDDFFGFSSAQMHAVLHFAFEPSPWFSFPQVLDVDPEAPILVLIHGIADAIDKNGLKATATGKLPQKLCRSIFATYKQYSLAPHISDFMKVNKEDDFFDLHVAKLIMELAGLLRKTKGYYYLTKKYATVMQKHGDAGLYPIIFNAYCTKFNWAYWDGYDEVPFIQQSFLFSLRMLKMLGDKEVPLLIYQDHFLQAFPMVTLEVVSESYFLSEEDEIRHSYSHRVLNKFLLLFGLAKITYKDQIVRLRSEKSIKQLPLLDEVVKFSI